MELASELQFELVWRALAAGWEGTSAPQPLDATPARLLAGVRFAIGDSLAAGHNIPSTIDPRVVCAGVDQLRLGGFNDPVVKEISLYWKVSCRSWLLPSSA